MAGETFIPQIIAHRGASADAPENTLASFKLGLEQGADAIEGDFRITKDGHIVCIHDADGNRTLKRHLYIANRTLEDLRIGSAGKWKGQQWESEKIPTLEEVLDLLPDGKPLYLEVKTGVEFLEPLAALIQERNILTSQLIPISYSQPFLKAFKQQFPQYKAYWLVKFERTPAIIGSHSPNPESVIQTVRELGVDGIDCRAQSYVDETFVQKLNDANIPFLVWTVNDLETARRFTKLGAIGLTTDKPGWLRGQLSK
jgi:glycerophosphoryl diester phosphodiesterase